MDAGQGAQGVADGVGGGHAGGVEGDAGRAGGDLHAAPGFQMVRLLHRRLQPAAQLGQGAQGQRRRDRVAPLAGRRLDGVNGGVDAGGGGQRRPHGGGSARVEQGEVEPQRLAPGPQLAPTGPEHRRAGDLRAGAGGGRHGDLGQSAPGQPGGAQRIGFGALALDGDGGRQLGGVHGGAAAQRHQAAGAFLPRAGGEGVDGPGRRFAPHLAAERHRVAGFGQRLRGAGRQAVFHQEGIGDQQHPRSAAGQARGIAPQPGQAAWAEGDGDRRAKGEGSGHGGNLANGDGAAAP